MLGQLQLKPNAIIGLGISSAIAERLYERMQKIILRGNRARQPLCYEIIPT